MGGYLYLCHPRDRYVAGVSACVQICRQEVSGWPGWVVRTYEYDQQNSLHAKDVSAQVIARNGPVVLIRPVQGRVVEELRMCLAGRTSVLVRDGFDENTMRAAVAEARTMHESGEPHLSRNLVVALLLMRKLDQERMWAGNAKGYMWADDIPKGRGLDEQHSDAVPHAINVLLQHDMLVQKTSKSSSKYALNPERREEIYDILRRRGFREPLARILARGNRLVSARQLDVLDEYDRAPR